MILVSRPRGTLRALGLVLLAAPLLSLACSSSSSSSPAADSGVTDSATSDGPVAESSTPDGSVTDSAPDGSTGKGLTISNATMASLNGTYDIQVFRIDQAGGGVAYNGNFDNKLELEVDTDAAGVVKAAHVWDYTGTGMTAMPNKFYGCDAKATACTGVTVDLATNLITLTGVTWPEVQSPAFDGSMPDVLVSGGGKVTVTGVIQATK